MTVQAYSSFNQWYREGPFGSRVRTMKTAGGIINLAEVQQPAGDVSGPTVPKLVLCQDLLVRSRVRGDLGGGRFDVTMEKRGFILAAPNFSKRAIVDTKHHIRAVAFPIGQWQNLLDEAAGGRFSLESSLIYGRMLDSLVLRSALRNLWSLCDEEGAPSRLLARAAGFEILAELCRLGGAPLAPARGGLAPWAERRCLDLMRARLSEDISLDELAAEAQLSPFHFARMFKRSIGVPPRVYLTQLRMEKTCELLERTDLPITQIAFEVGYSSNQVLARVFIKHQHMSPSDYRRAMSDLGRPIVQH